MYGQPITLFPKGDRMKQELLYNSTRRKKKKSPRYKEDEGHLDSRTSPFQPGEFDTGVSRNMVTKHQHVDEIEKKSKQNNTTQHFDPSSN